MKVHTTAVEKLTRAHGVVVDHVACRFLLAAGYLRVDHQTAVDYPILRRPASTTTPDMLRSNWRLGVPPKLATLMAA